MQTNAPFFALVLSAVVSTQLSAQSFEIKPQAISSQSQLDIKGLEIGDQASVWQNFADEPASLSTVGGGLSLEMQLDGPMRVGMGLALMDFEGEKGDISYSDTIWNTYTSFDLIDQEVIAIFGKVGLSYHHLSLQDMERGPLRFSVDSTGLLNYDLGLGSRFRLNESTHFSLEYRYTDTFSRNDAEISSSAFGLTSSSAKLTEIGLTNHELMASLGFSF